MEKKYLFYLQIFEFSINFGTKDYSLNDNNNLLYFRWSQIEIIMKFIINDMYLIIIINISI